MCCFFLLAVEILSEDAILKWYKESHSQRGWSVFMDQMKKFIEWLEQAEEGNYCSFLDDLEAKEDDRERFARSV